VSEGRFPMSFGHEKRGGGLQALPCLGFLGSRNTWSLENSP
jgi:hypothetical protein